MAISSPGIGSGLDINGIITKLMQVEQQPLIKLSGKEASFQSKISALGSVQSAVASLNSAVAALAPASGQTATSKFVTYKASVGESSVASATASATSVPGSYALEVSQLATTHRISTTARAHTLDSASYASATDAIAEGTLGFTVNGTTTQITISSANATLGGLKSAINAANAGVTASIVDDGIDDGLDNVKLVLTSNTGGAAGQIDITSAELPEFTFDAASQSGGLTETQVAEGGYTSTSAAIAEGTLALTLGNGTARQIVIDSSNNTLSGLRDAINASGAGVTATLNTISANDVRLVLTSNTIGSGSKITLSGLTGFAFDPSSGTGDLSQAANDGGQAAQGSIIKLNGITINNDSNTVTDAVEGVTLALSKVSTGATTLSVSQDKSSALSTALTNIVKAYNDLNKTVRDLGSYNAETKQGGPLLGNSTLRSVSSAIRNLFQSPVEGNGASDYKRLSDLGLEIQKDGSIKFNTSKLVTATNADFDTVGNLAATFGTAAKTLTDGMLGSGGSITAATDGAKVSIKNIDKQRETLSLRLTQIEARYKRQFSALDSLIASMNTTSSYLSQQLASLPGNSRN